MKVVCFILLQKLEAIVLPNSIESIGYMAFSFSGISSVNIPKSMTAIESRSFDNCKNLTFIDIPTGITTIGSMAFYNCKKVSSVIIPYTVNSIGGSCFSGCEDLMDVYCYNENVPHTTLDIFDGWISSATLHVPEEAIETYGSDSHWNGFNKIISLVPICKTPVITITDGILEITSATKGAEIVTNVTFGGGKITGGNTKIVLTGTTACHITAYATKEDYVDSEIATADVELSVGKKGDVNQDGVVSISDAVGVVNIILNGGGAEAAPAVEEPAESIEAE